MTGFSIPGIVRVGEKTVETTSAPAIGTGFDDGTLESAAGILEKAESDLLLPIKRDRDYRGEWLARIHNAVKENPESLKGKTFYFADEICNVFDRGTACCCRHFTVNDAWLDSLDQERLTINAECCECGEESALFCLVSDFDPIDLRVKILTDGEVYDLRFKVATKPDESSTSPQEILPLIKWAREVRKESQDAITTLPSPTLSPDHSLPRSRFTQCVHDRVAEMAREQAAVEAKPIKIDPELLVGKTFSFSASSYCGASIGSSRCWSSEFSIVGAAEYKNSSNHFDILVQRKCVKCGTVHVECEFSYFNDFNREIKEK